MAGNLTNPRSPTGSARDKQGATRATTPNTLLKAARHRHGWTQQALAGQLGTTSQAINRWDQGKALPSAYFRTRLCDLFGLTTEEPLAMVAQGQWQAARTIVELLDHPETADSLHALAVFYHVHHHIAQAESLYQQALAIRGQQFGAQHCKTQATRDRYAELLRDVDRNNDVVRISCSSPLVPLQKVRSVRE